MDWRGERERGAEEVGGKTINQTRETMMGSFNEVKFFLLSFPSKLGWDIDGGRE